MYNTYTLHTPTQGFVDITAIITQALREHGVKDGICLVYCPHTTAGITINENADPDVLLDLLLGFDRAFPDNPHFRHQEGNSAAHLKASAVGSSVSVIIENGQLVLGTWQGIYFCEFDGPRTRNFCVKIQAD